MAEDVRKDLDRLSKTTALLNKEMAILEIGPSYNPTVPKSQGWNSFSLDHATQEELRDKYKGAANIENIEPVDFVWNDGPLENAVPTQLHGTFDAVVACHVIEHFPDTIAFYLSAAKLLRDQGIISLVVPDKRVTFDFFKPITLTSDLLYAHWSNSSRHTKKTAFDNLAYNVKDGDDIAWWEGKGLANLNFATPNNALVYAMDIFDRTVESSSSAYVDYHNTLYTPASFELIILELGQLGVIPFEVISSDHTSGCEFFVTLRKTECTKLPVEELNSRRMGYLKKAVREVADQAAWILN